jgi:hypothetical protein
VYVPVVVLFIVAGDHVPVIGGIFVDDVGSTGAILPLQSGGNGAKIGTIELVLITCVKVVANAHCPAAGVNVYVPFVVLLTVTGDQLPLIGVASVDDPGNTGAVLPLQMAASAVNVGVIVAGFTVCTNVVVVAH